MRRLARIRANPACPAHGLAALALAITVGLATPAAAQVRTRPATDPELARIESLIEADRIDAARTALGTWAAGHPAATGSDRAAADVLRGRLARTWVEAEEAYRAAARIPVTSAAPQALLRLGQGLVLAAKAGFEPTAASRAAGYLERLVADYPNAPERTEAFLWLARALEADGRTAVACRRLQQAPAAAADSVTAALIDSMRQTQCNQPLVFPAPPR